jgi:hypothetical protein
MAKGHVHADTKTRLLLDKMHGIHDQALPLSLDSHLTIQVDDSAWHDRHASTREAAIESKYWPAIDVIFVRHHKVAIETVLG